MNSTWNSRKPDKPHNIETHQENIRKTGQAKQTQEHRLAYVILFICFLAAYVCFLTVLSGKQSLVFSRMFGFLYVW